MSKRKVQLASKYGLSMPSVATPYGHDRQGVRKRAAREREFEAMMKEKRAHPQVVPPRPPLVRKKAPEG
jgi:hypothetical protein